MFGGLGPQELMIVFLIVLLLFGGKKIPEVARGLGKGMREFKKGVKDIKEDIDTVTSDVNSLPSSEPEKTDPPNNESETAQA